MSRSALLVSAGLFALGILVWLLTAERDPPAETAPPPAVAGAPVAANPAPFPVEPASRPLAPAQVAPAGPLPRVASRDDLAKALKARGLDPDKLIAGYQQWRVARGFLGADPLAGVTPGNAPMQVYATMDYTTLKSLVDSGDVGALQAHAAGSLSGDPFTAIEYYRRASEHGSAAAMAGMAEALASLSTVSMADVQNDQSVADRLLAIRGGDPNRDLRRDAVAWTLASIRQYGPAVANAANLELVQGWGRSTDQAMLTAICGQSLAILADLTAATAATAGRDAAALPPVFVTQKGLYDRLPCGDTPAPVTPPRALAACTSSPAIGSNNEPVELWICPQG